MFLRNFCKNLFIDTDHGNGMIYGIPNENLFMRIFFKAEPYFNETKQNFLKIMSDQILFISYV